MRSDFMEILRHPLVSLLVHVYAGDSDTKSRAKQSTMITPPKLAADGWPWLIGVWLGIRAAVTVDARWLLSPPATCYSAPVPMTLALSQIQEFQKKPHHPRELQEYNQH